MKTTSKTFSLVFISRRVFSFIGKRTGAEGAVCKRFLIYATTREGTDDIQRIEHALHYPTRKQYIIKPNEIDIVYDNEPCMMAGETAVFVLTSLQKWVKM